MKKLLVVIVLLLIVTGCTKSNNNQVSDSDTVLFEVNGTSYTKGELYSSLTASDYSDTVLSDLKLKLAELEEIDLTELNESAEEYYDYIASYGDYYVDYYGGKDAILNSYIQYYIDEEIIEDYISCNIEDYKNDYSPFKAQYAYFDTQEDAQNMIDLVKAGSTFEMAAAEAGYEYECAETVYTDRDSSLANEVKAYCKDADSGLSSAIVSSTTTTDSNGDEVITAVYYVVNLIDKDANNFKEDFVDYMVNNEYVDIDVVLNNKFADHNISIHDQNTYDSLADTYEALAIK